MNRCRKTGFLFDHLADTISFNQDIESEDDAATVTPSIYIPTTSAASSVDGWEPRDEQALNFASVPCLGFVFIMRSASCGRLLRAGGNGEVVLMRQVSPMDASWKWECVETNGCLGFRNIKTGRFWGHGGWSDILRCSQTEHKGWEMFEVRHQPQGGYVMLMEHWSSARPIGIKVENGMDTLAKVDVMPSNGRVWEFAILNEANNDKDSG